MMKATSLCTAAAFACAFSLGAFAAEDAVAKKQAEADYKAAISQCKSMKGTEKATCEKDAKVKLNDTLAAARFGASTGSSSMGATGTSTSPNNGAPAMGAAPDNTAPSAPRKY